MKLYLTILTLLKIIKDKKQKIYFSKLDNNNIKPKMDK